MSVTRIFDSFDAIPGTFEHLLNVTAKESPFLSRVWFENFTDTISVDGALIRIYAVESDTGEAIALLPMKAGEGARRRFARHCISSLSNFYTPLFSLLTCDRRHIPAAAKALGEALIVDPAGWDTIDLRPLAHECESFAALEGSLRAAGFLVQAYFCFGNWHLKVEGRSFDQYLHTVPAELRNTLARKSRRLNSAGTSRIDVIKLPEDLEAAIAAYETVYASSWKVAEPYPKFIRGMIRACAVQGSLRLGLLYVKGEPAAAQIWIVANGKAAIYKLAYDPRFAKFSVGSILTAELMRYVIDIDKVTEVDYLGGDEAYKSQWMSHRRERWGLLAFNPRRVYGLMAAARHIGGRALKNASIGMLEKVRTTGRKTSSARR